MGGAWALRGAEEAGVKESPTRSSWAWVVVLMTIVGSLGSASGVAGQTLPQFDLNQFRPSELTTDGFAVSNADGQGHLRFGVQVYLDFSRDPMELQVTNGPIPDQRLQLVHSQLTGHLTWSLGLWERLVVFMDLPYTFILGDNLSDEGAAFLDSIGQGLLIPSGKGPRRFVSGCSRRALRDAREPLSIGRASHFDHEHRVRREAAAELPR